jgi:hypothetical protein
MKRMEYLGPKDFEKLVQWFDEQDDFTLIIIDFQILK